MLQQDNNEELKQISRKIVMANIFGVPSSILLGLGFYGKFAAQGDAFIDILNNQDVVHGCLAIGGVIMLLEIFYIISLSRRRAKLLQRQ